MNNALLFVRFLEIRLKNDLPGFQAQMKMAPLYEKNIARSFKPTDNARKSAVLILISSDDNNNIQILLTLRSEKLKSHSGQISFPGGRSDNDETPEETALREAFEEINLNINNTKVIGRLSDLFVPPSNSYIVPVLAYTNKIEKLEANIHEVSEIFFIHLDQIYEEDSINYFSEKFGAKEIKYPYWNVHHKTKLWGATAIILSELLELYREFKKSL